MCMVISVERHERFRYNACRRQVMCSRQALETTHRAIRRSIDVQTYSCSLPGILLRYSYISPSEAISK